MRCIDQLARRLLAFQEFMYCVVATQSARIYQIVDATVDVRCQYRPWADRVACNALIERLNGYRTREPEQRRLRRDVIDAVSRRPCAIHRGHVEDASPTALAHAGQRQLDSTKRRRQIHGQCAVPVLERE